MSEIYVCSQCHHTSTAHWHRLTPGLIGALIKLRQAVREHQRNDIDIHHEMNLSTTEAMNWTKLRFHGLVAKVKVDGQVKRGHWLITRRGSEFLRGECRLPARVKTLNNHVVERDSETVHMVNVYGSVPYFESIETIESERQPLNLTQASLGL